MCDVLLFLLDIVNMWKNSKLAPTQSIYRMDEAGNEINIIY